MLPRTSLQKQTASADEEEEVGDVSEEEEMEEYFEEEIVEEAEEDDEVEQVEEEEEKEDHKVPEEDVKVEVQKQEEEEKLAKPAQRSKESSGSESHSPTVDPPFFMAVTHLKKLHNALSVFLHQLDSLNRSFDWISAAIDALVQRRCHLLEMEKNENSKLQVICETMGGKALRNYVINNLSNRGRLRNELLEVLRCVQNPEKLLLEAMGRFYMQGSRSYKNNEQLVSFRCACILLLESYVLTGLATDDSSVKEEAKTVALAWFKRLINDSSFGDAVAMDSLGLILFLACYGIPEEIGFRELYNLLRQTNLKKKADVFRHSNILVEKIPGVIKELIRADMLVGAAELSCSFELQETFPPLPLLSSFVAKVMQVGKEEPLDHRPILLEGHVQQLRSLESVTKCLEDYDLDANELGPISIYKEIARLKNETVNCKKESHEGKFKRKTEEAEVHRQSKKPFKKPRPSIAKESWSTPKHEMQQWLEMRAL
ncbi:hypothetical protein HPP92_011378 [Vanilla planifolia]|uniref:FRIGIDA-like protein n=1 Tax=Vanilla planifolia TaxID=51239 RepID=A0A835V0Y8_VANPL|nr:hypothetical protein HPP92_011378 [Vanilla planifolia]